MTDIDIEYFFQEKRKTISKFDWAHQSPVGAKRKCT